MNSERGNSTEPPTLAKSNSISQEELEDSRLRVVQANYLVQELEAKQKLLQSVRDEDVRMLRAEVQAAISRVSTAKQNLALCEIVSLWMVLFCGSTFEMVSVPASWYLRTW